MEVKCGGGLQSCGPAGAAGHPWAEPCSCSALGSMLGITPAFPVLLGRHPDAPSQTSTMAMPSWCMIDLRLDQCTCDIIDCRGRM